MTRVRTYIARAFAFLMIGAVVIYMGACVFINWIEPHGPSVPDASKAPYVFIEQYTGEQVLAQTYTKKGPVYVLSTYWQMGKGGNFTYHNAPLTLDPRIFGPITVVERQVTANAN